MIATVYRPSRVKDGRRVIGRMYRAKYRLDPRDKIKDVPLHTNDKQVAQQKLRKILEEEQARTGGIYSAEETERSGAAAAVGAYRNLHRGALHDRSRRKICARVEKEAAGLDGRGSLEIYGRDNARKFLFVAPETEEVSKDVE